VGADAPSQRSSTAWLLPNRSSSPSITRADFTNCPFTQLPLWLSRSATVTPSSPTVSVAWRRDTDSSDSRTSTDGPRPTTCSPGASS